MVKNPRCGKWNVTWFDHHVWHVCPTGAAKVSPDFERPVWHMCLAGAAEMLAGLPEKVLSASAGIGGAAVTSILTKEVTHRDAEVLYWGDVAHCGTRTRNLMWSKTAISIVYYHHFTIIQRHEMFHIHESVPARIFGRTREIYMYTISPVVKYMN